MFALTVANHTEYNVRTYGGESPELAFHASFDTYLLYSRCNENSMKNLLQILTFLNFDKILLKYIIIFIELFKSLCYYQKENS